MSATFRETQPYLELRQDQIILPGVKEIFGDLFSRDVLPRMQVHPSIQAVAARHMYVPESYPSKLVMCAPPVYQPSSTTEKVVLATQDSPLSSTQSSLDSGGSSIGARPSSLAPSARKDKSTTRAESRKWDKVEDRRLVYAVNKYTINKRIEWKRVVSYVGNNRSQDQCRQRYIRHLAPWINHGPWTTEEDRQLLSAVSIYGEKKWVIVSKMIPGRTYLQCQSRNTKLKRELKRR